MPDTRFVFSSRAWRLRISAALTAAVLAFAAVHFLKLFDPLPMDRAQAISRIVTDREGRLLRAFAAPDDRWRLDVSPSSVSQNYLDMLFAFEDQRFARHPGVDPFAMARAFWQAVEHGRTVSGASTITMQVARLLRGSPTQSLPAKLQQFADAFRLEWLLTKNEILALYLKLAPFGGNLEGVRAASLAYFGKEPLRLSIAEAATLVAIPQSPELRRPDRNPQAVRAARDRVLTRAFDAGLITQADALWAKSQPAASTRRDFPARAAHLSARLVSAYPDNTRIVTALDRDLQETAETIVRRHAALLGEKLSIAAIIVNHDTGGILAHIGSPDYFDESRLGAIDMTAAVRSPGSALKPFIYGLAFEQGLAHPDTLIEDRPVRFDQYAPANFDGSYHGTVTMREALQLSLNVPAVKVLAEIGPARLSARFREAGFNIALPRNLTVALGGTGMTLENLTALYAALARGGNPIALNALAPQAGIADKKTQTPALLTPQAAWYLQEVLRATPPPANTGGGGIAFKTGTSYGYRDAWAAGFDGKHTIAVWIGRADATAVPGLMGLQAAAPLLFELFAAIGSHREPLPAAAHGVLQVRRNSTLPPPLRRFRETGPAFSASSAQPESHALNIAFPPDNVEIELGGNAMNERMSVPFKAEGGTLPLTWLVDGQPITSTPHRRDVFWQAKGRGFVQVTVVDANGQSDRRQFRLR